MMEWVDGIKTFSRWRLAEFIHQICIFGPFLRGRG